MEIKETAKIAAKWWADKLRYGTVHDNGEAEISFMMNLIASLPGRVLKDEERINEFETKLAELISEELEKREYVYLRVDYHPEGLLREAATEVNIDLEFQLPVKTSMEVSEKEVKVAEGYRSQYKQIFPNPTQQPKI